MIMGIFLLFLAAVEKNIYILSHLALTPSMLGTQLQTGVLFLSDFSSTFRNIFKL